MYWLNEAGCPRPTVPVATVGSFQGETNIQRQAADGTWHLQYEGGAESCSEAEDGIDFMYYLTQTAPVQ